MPPMMENTMKASEMLKFFEMAQTFQKPAKPVRKKKEKLEDPDLYKMYIEAQAKADMLKKFIGDVEKLNKKDEKKDEKSKLGIKEVALYFMAASPIIGPVYYYWLTTVLTAARVAH